MTAMFEIPTPDLIRIMREFSVRASEAVENNDPCLALYGVIGSAAHDELLLREETGISVDENGRPFLTV
ncbi:hypothetical protein ACGFJ7_44795 [Actinoplanes sp. NPDC048988]|uniref:hypothetical protein n=1 Tax=Actinoplanes sp. NPDC048988 TaxID=3363901 RepID=UPI0037190B18